MVTVLPGNILYGGPADINEALNFKSLGHFCLEKFKNYDNLIVMIDAATGQEYTAKYMYDAIVRLAHVLNHLGVQSNDVVGLSSENRIEFAVTLFAAFAVNATVAPLNVTYSEREVHHALNLSKPKVVFASKSTIKMIAKVAKENSFVKALVVFSPTCQSSNIYSYDKLMESKKILSHNTFDSPVANKKEDVALIVCSSGTTGLPKGVQITQYNIVSIQPTNMQMDNIKLLSVIPWYHVFGCISLITTSMRSMTLVFLPKFEEKLFLGAIQKYRVFTAFMVPPLMVFLAKHPLVDKYDLSSLKVLFCGAAPLSKETEDQVKKRIGLPMIRQGYGMSEATLGVLGQTDDNCKPGSVGTLKKGVYAKVIDPDTGKILSSNQRGELCFKSDTIMKAYVGDPKSTETAIQHGWLHTGDIGYYDNDFEFFIVDRIKELIKYKAYQVPPAEVEALLLTNPKIKDAAVIGKPDEEAGELPLAFVVKQPNAHITEDEIVKFVAERSSPAKKLRGGVIFIDEVPKNTSGKILRRVLREILKTQKSKL